MIPAETRLPRRDWFLLPLLSVFSLALLLGLSEVAARVIWTEQPRDACAVPDAKFGFRYKPNCTAEMKTPETPWVVNAYNACGYRTAEPCGPKPPGGFRVAVIGSSISSGHLVPYPETFAARATKMLSASCHIPVDFQNLSVTGTGLQLAPLHLDAALALRPDVLLLSLSVYDIQTLDKDVMVEAEATPATGFRGALANAVIAIRASRVAEVAQHYLYQNLDTYLPLYLSHGDEADYLRMPFGPAWLHRLSLFDEEVANIAARARASNVPFMLMFVPSRPQAALMLWGRRPVSVDPDALGKAIGEIASRHGVAYLDLTETFGRRSDAADLFYPVDGHPNGQAAASIAGKLVRALTLDDKALAASCHDGAMARK